MAVYELDGVAPKMADSAWVADSAQVIGKVELGEDVSVWFGTVIRGDSEVIRIGKGSNIQDASVLHADPGVPLTLGENVSVGHQVMLHGCTVGDGTLIGIGAVVLNRARIGRNCLVGAGALVTEGKEFPDGSMILGSPARVARQLGISERELHQFEIAALLHDVGKIGVPDSILRKPGPLDPDERAAMNKHPEYSWTILRMLHGLETASLFALHHHEGFDGKGYPAGLRGTEIPIGSRIVSVIDAFDAMVSSRPYRKGLPVDEAIRRLILSSGTQFDPQIVQCFLKIVQPELHNVFAAAGTGIHAAL